MLLDPWHLYDNKTQISHDSRAPFRNMVLCPDSFLFGQLTNATKL
jgi:hypothetical protein